MQCCWITAIADLLDLTRGAMVGARPRVGFTGKPQSEHETNYQRTKADSNPMQAEIPITRALSHMFQNRSALEGQIPI